MSSRSTQQYYSGLIEKGLSYGLSAGAVNFFLAYGEDHLQKYIERNVCRELGAHQPSSLPVYGPSKTPRLQQFVDLATNCGGMTPFSLVGNDVNNHVYNRANERTCEETDEGEKLQNQKYWQQQQYQQQRQGGEKPNCVMMLLTNGHVTCTPQHHKQPPRVPVDTSTTPSSVTGMTLSPATVCRDLAHATPTSTAMTSSIIRLETRTQQVTATKPPVVTLFGRSNSLANELGSVFDELADDKRVQVTLSGRSEKTDVSGNHTVTTTTLLCNDDHHSNENVHDDTSQRRRRQRGLAARRNERSAQRRGKEKGRDKTKSGSRDQHVTQSNNASDAGCPSLIFPAAREKDTLAANAKQYYLSLQCHCDRKVLAFTTDVFNIGDHVIFVADRGFDLGKVVHCEKTGDEAGAREPREDGRLAATRVLRPATEEEVAEWGGALAGEEGEALVECRAACKELGLTIHVAAAAFQFDRQKLIFMYESEKRVDFRVLLQVMFSKYRCRIWMERISPAQ